MGKTILFVSHDLSSISKHCDRVVLLNKGTKLGEGTPKEMIDAYKQVLVGQFAHEKDEKLSELPTMNMNGENADAVVIVGDFVDDGTGYDDMITACKALSTLRAKYGVYFVSGNHDIWTYRFFEDLGIRKVQQPFFTTFDGKVFCVGHGDRLGGAKWSYRLMLGVFHCRAAQAVFSTLHPWLAYRIGLGWSDSNRRTHKPYHFECGGEPLYAYARKTLSERPVDCFVFGHFHDGVDVTMSEGSRFVVLKDWISGGTPHAVWTGEELLTSF